MKVKFYLDLSHDVNLNKLLLTNGLGMYTEPGLKMEGHDRLRVIVDIPLKYLSHDAVVDLDVDVEGIREV